MLYSVYAESSAEPSDPAASTLASSGPTRECVLGLARLLFARRILAQRLDTGRRPRNPRISVDSSNANRLHDPRIGFTLTPRQKSRVDGAITSLQPLISALQRELDEKERRFLAMRPSDTDFVSETAYLSNEMGTLTTQIALIANKMKADIYDVLSDEQREVLNQLASELIQPNPSTDLDVADRENYK